MRFFTCLAIALVFSSPYFNARANQNNLDKVEYLYQLAYQIEESNPDSALIYLNQAQQLTKTNPHPKLPYIYKLTAYIYLNNGSANKAYTFYNKAYTLFESQSDTLQMAHILNNLAIVERQNGNVLQAEKNYLKAAVLFNNLKAYNELANIYLNISAFYSNIGQPTTADNFAQKAYETGQQTNNTAILAKTNQYFATRYLQQGLFTDAMLCYDKNLALLENSNFNNELANTYFGIATVYRELADYQNVITYLNQAIKLAQRTNARQILVKSLNETGFVYNEWENPQLAIDFFNTAIENEPNSESLNTAHALAGLGEAYDLLNIYKKSFDSYSEALHIFETNHYKAGMVQAYIHLANLTVKYNHNQQTTLEYYKKANMASIGLNDDDLLSQLWLSQGLYYYQNQQYKLAELYLIKTLENPQTDLQNQLNSNITLAELHKKNNNLPLSIKYYQIALQLKDSVFKQQQQIEYNAWILKQNQSNKSINAAATELQSTYNIKHNNVYIITLSIITLLLALVSLYLWRSGSKKNQSTNNQVHQLVKELEQTKQQLRDLNVEVLDAKAKADKANQFKNKFLTNISHEIRTPLNAISGYAKLLARQNKNDINHKYAENIILSSDSLQNILNNLLDFSKIESGQLRIEQQEFSPFSTITQVIADNKYKASVKNVAIELHIDPLMPDFVIGDPIRLVQILDNVIDNAIKYSYEGKAVTFEVLSATINQTQAQFTFNITDRGIGIDPEKIDTIFKSYSRLEKTPNKNDGPGIGLAITKGLVELQNGTLKVESQIDGPTTFTIKLTYPIANRNNQNANNTLSKPKLETQIKILLAEDNLINRELAVDTIASWGPMYTCDVVENGEQTIEQLKQQPYHVVLMDIQMPVMDGYTATRYIRAQMPQPICNIPIIGLTAFAFDKERKEALQNGMNAYITKPFDPMLLKQAIDDLVR